MSQVGLPGNRGRGLVLCTVGTDHHPFDRLVRWCDTFAASTPDVEVLVQHGSSPPPRVATAEAFLAKERLSALLDTAHVVITHGGPGSISDARRLGTRPIVLPRDPALGEHVDDHQLRFTKRLARSGLVLVVSSEVELHHTLREELARPRGAGIDVAAEEARVCASALRFGDLVERLLSQHRR